MICKACVMDESDKDIVFDNNGICNWCHSNGKTVKSYQRDPKNSLRIWKKQVEIIKKTHNPAEYDAILGISGGIDSSYTALVTYRYDLNILLVNCENHFTAEIAKHNLKNVVDYTGYDLHQHILDLEEFASLQKSFFRAMVLDLDIPSDYAIEAIIRDVAVKKKIPFIVSGGNFCTNGFMPDSFTFRNKRDWHHMMNIYRKFGSGKPLKTFPKYGFWEVIWSKRVHNIKTVYPLNLIGYNRIQAPTVLSDTFGYNSYQDVHGENIFTRFYQRYILPVRFGIDKRRVHYSCLIHAGQMTREDALKRLEQPPYNDPHQIEEDKALILEKLGLTRDELEQYMIMPIHRHEEYGTQEDLWSYQLITWGLRQYKRLRRNIHL